MSEWSKSTTHVFLNNETLWTVKFCEWYDEIEKKECVALYVFDDCGSIRMHSKDTKMEPCEESAEQAVETVIEMSRFMRGDRVE